MKTKRPKGKDIKSQKFKKANKVTLAKVNSEAKKAKRPKRLIIRP